MKKHKLYFLIFLFSLLLALFWGCNQRAATVYPSEPLAAAFLATGAVGEEIRLAAWSKISPHALNEEELNKYVAKTAKAFAPNLIKDSATVFGSFLEIVYSGTWDNCNYRIIGQASKEGSHIFAALQTFGPCTLLPGLRKSCLEALPEETEINTLLIGTIYEDLSPDKLKERFALALESAGAKKIEEALGENFYSISAFTPGILPQVEAGGENINLQLGASMGRGGKINIYAGSPLIFIDY